MRLSPEAFEGMTPAEFIYAWLGWSSLEVSRTRQAWERERWAVWVATCIQLDRKDRLPMREMFPLPWEELHERCPQLTLKERKKRIDEMKACIRK